jgi:hypothetical protein
MQDDNGYHSFSINPTCITSWYNSLTPKRHFPNPEGWKKNFEHKEHNNKISKQASKKIFKAVDYLLYIAKSKPLPLTLKGKGMLYKIGFVTLTLSSPQIHTDTEIKKELLQPLLSYFRQHYKCEHYIWRAEKQKNGRTHFHILIDKFIPWLELRNVWNKYQQNLGYVTRYRELQKQLHADGFRFRATKNEKWTYNRQKQAYLNGEATNWNNPNSTDVHAIRNVKNIRKYISKYLSKNEQSQTKEELPTNPNTADVLAISGRLWGLSESLSKIQGARLDEDSGVWAEIDKVDKETSIVKYSGDFFQVWYCTIDDLKRLGCEYLLTVFKIYIKETFSSN